MLVCDTNMEMGLIENDSGQGVDDAALERDQGVQTDKTGWWVVTTGYDCAAVLIECVHSCLVRFTVPVLEW